MKFGYRQKLAERGLGAQGPARPIHLGGGQELAKCEVRLIGRGLYRPVPFAFGLID